VASDGGRCKLSVSDSGPGIPANERDLVLHRFHRLNHGDAPGSGLGLAIVARIAELHGAELTLADNDQAPGLLASVSWKQRADGGRSRHP
jgi:two-component system sensor histidine kinase QseC